MPKFTGAALTEMRNLIKLCDGHKVLFAAEKPFIDQMKVKASRAVMILTEKQYEWLLSIANRVVDFNGRFKGGQG